MQKKVQIVSDGSLDLPQELTREKDIEVVPFYVSFDSETYKKEVVEIGIRDFYQEMVDHPDVFPKSSMPSVDDFYHAFEKSAKENIPVICICITKKFSGSLQSATVAKGMIEEKYPQAKITVIDSTINTVLQGLFVLEACRLRDMGMDYEEIIEKILPIRETGRILFTVGSIDYLQHGGRIGKLAGIAAGALGIKPMITLKEGEIFSSGLARGRVRSMKKVVDMTREYLDEVNAKPGEYSFCIGYGYDYEEAVKFREMLKNLVKERLGVKVRSVELNVCQRCSSSMLSKTDQKEAIASGAYGVKAALNGASGKMVAFERLDGDDYQIDYVLKDVNVICNQEKCVPATWITADGSDVTEDFIRYARPLIQGEVTVPTEDGVPKFAYRK